MDRRPCWEALVIFLNGSGRRNGLWLDLGRSNKGVTGPLLTVVSPRPRVGRVRPSSAVIGASSDSRSCTGCPFRRRLFFSRVIIASFNLPNSFYKNPSPSSHFFTFLSQPLKHLSVLFHLLPSISPSFFRSRGFVGPVKFRFASSSSLSSRSEDHGGDESPDNSVNSDFVTPESSPDRGTLSETPEINRRCNRLSSPSSRRSRKAKSDQALKRRKVVPSGPSSSWRILTPVEVNNRIFADNGDALIN
ncbi:unnamed protein product [Microthlaspi erraticum]|uniref:Uncharacterized protein n=1 Tax=Microthlaspi erraticum TaxID=1685480 RepID=A0A6D2IWS2_9BRAS|nr:unnamed protein product [Microthlaspi erraticum]